MTPRHLHVVVPGTLDQRTGGYRYDARMVEGLRNLGWRVDVHALDGAFPLGESGGREALSSALAELPDGCRVAIDGLAGGGIPEPIEAHAGRLQLLSIVHHPLADETGLSPATRQKLVESETRTLAACRGVIVTSDTTARRVEGFGVPSDRIRTVTPGTERAPVAQGPASGEPPRLLCVGTVTPRKGHDVLLDALAALRDLEWTCVCAGSLERDPVFATSVAEQCVALDLTDRVTFVGECDDPHLEALFAGGSLFVSASLYEGYGMAFAEALVRGLPVVGTTGGAIAQTVPKDAGVLVPPGDSMSLAHALRALLQDSKRLSELRAAAVRHAARLPTWDQAAADFARAIEALVSYPTGAAPAGGH